MRMHVGLVVSLAAGLTACAGSRLDGCCGPAPRPCVAAAACDAPCRGTPPPSPCMPPRECVSACAAGFFDGYVPVVPTPESRIAFTALIFPATPFLGTQGDGDTPRGGGVSLNFTRIDDERRFLDDEGTQYELDGELQVVTLEWVSPRQSLNLCGSCVPFHVGLSLSAYSGHQAMFDWLRDFVEENVVGQDPGVDAAHNPGGREFSATTFAGDRTDFIDESPMWKAKGILKVPLPDFDVGGRPGRWSASLGVTAPAFGSHDASGNDTVVPELVLAASVPLSEKFRLTGAGSLTVPGSSRAFDDLGIDHDAVVAAGFANVEWWASCKFAVSLGLSVNGAYTRDSGLPSDYFSFYLNMGVLYRLSDRAEVHLLVSENPTTQIVTDGDADSDYTLNTQRDADFTITIGGSISF
jgi:hypothetical protein